MNPRPLLPLTHDDLVRRAVRWLRNTRGCRVVFAEIVTFAATIPDAIGWRREWSILVECKTSRADFFADKKKAGHRAGYTMGQERWYMTSPGLVRADEVPDGWGLLEAHERRVTMALKPPGWAKCVGVFHDDPAVYRQEMVLLLSALRRHQLGVEWLGPDARFVTIAEADE